MSGKKTLLHQISKVYNLEPRETSASIIKANCVNYMKVLVDTLIKRHIKIDSSLMARLH